MAFQLLAIAGAIAYILLGNALPEFGGRLLAGAILVWLLGALIWRFVQVVRNPTGSVPGIFNRRT